MLGDCKTTYISCELQKNSKYYFIYWVYNKKQVLLYTKKYLYKSVKSVKEKNYTKKIKIIVTVHT